MMRWFVVLLLVSFICIGVQATSFPWSTIPAFRFPESRFYATPVGLETVDGYVAAFGDFNADKYTDIFIVTNNRSVLEVWLWDAGKLKFSRNPQATIQCSNDESSSISSFSRAISPCTIENVVALDFDDDGMLDIMLAVRKGNDSVELQLFMNKDLETFESQIFRVEENLLGQPLILDWNGDQRVDLFGLSANSGKPTVWLNTGKRDRLFQVRSLEDLAPSLAKRMCNLSRTHSHAFVDMDGDCLADIVVTCGDPRNAIQIWSNRKEAGFELVFESSLLPGNGLLSFIDMNGDGITDIVYPVCDPEPNCDHQHGWQIMNSVSLPWCDYSIIREMTDCRSMNRLCGATDRTHRVAFEESIISIKDHFHDLQSAGYRLANSVPASMGSGSEIIQVPLPIRVGDFNLDGCPDFLVTMRKPKENDYRVLLFEGVCSREKSTFNLTRHHDWETWTETVSPHAFSAGFFDLHEDGTLDMIVMSYTDEHRHHTNLTVFYNNLFNDAYFMKILTLTSVCPIYCHPPVSDTRRVPFKPSGAPMVGASVKYTITDWNTKKRVVQGHQLTQTSYMALPMPYLFFGLGRANNYVEELYVAIPTHEDQHYRKWICIIPNSQLLVLPQRVDDRLTDR
jgi:integrin alpha FG-GAP repeat containing protein 1